MRKKIKQLCKRLRPFKTLESDIYLASFPKSGNTWIRFVISDALSHSYNLNTNIDESTINHFTLAGAAPAEYTKGAIQKQLAKKGASRVIKTHDLYNDFYTNSIYIVRDPKDVMVSYFYYAKNKSKQFHGSFPDFLRHENLGLANWFEHVNSWQNNYRMIIQYEALLENPMKGFKEILEHVRITNLNDNQILDIIDNNSLKSLRAKNPSLQINKSYNFFRKGIAGDWQNHFTENDIEYYNNMFNKYKSQIPIVDSLYSTVDIK